MEYQELEDVYEFHRNMRKTPWEQLFPHWWDTTDALIKVIGDEVERIKTISVFSLLNAGIKPPVLVWQESVVHNKYTHNFHFSQLPQSKSIQAPLYKTWGKLTLTNNTAKDIDGLQISLDETHGIVINQLIAEADKLVIDLVNDKVLLNKEKIEAEKIGDGIPYFITQRNKDEYDENTPLHNEVIRVTLSTFDEMECDIDVEIELDNVVFTNEQNIEVTGLEAVPIERIELYAEYDFPFNHEYNGWHKVYEKKYDSNTNVVYDMITKQFYTKRFYADVWFKTLQYPYRVGFPCYKGAEENSEYHVNDKIDTWGEQLGLKRRLYRTDIDEEEYANTYPAYYPFDIEQDYWYYKRLTNEYTWNEMPINDVDIKDTDGNEVIRLYSINPFVEDFVVHAKSQYPKDNDFNNCCKYDPITVQQKRKAGAIQTDFSDIINILLDDKKYTSVVLNNASNNNDVIYKRDKKKNNNYDSDIGYIRSNTNESSELITYFDLSDLPQDVNIDNITVEVEAESTDNKKNKYSTELTGLIIPDYDGTETFIPLSADKDYQLKKQVINYTNNELSKKLLNIIDENIVQDAQIGVFKGRINGTINIPFKLKENSVVVDDITNVWIYYDDTVQRGTYDNTNQIIYAHIPDISTVTEMTIMCESRTHKTFKHTISVNQTKKYIEGPIVKGAKKSLTYHAKWNPTITDENIIQDVIIDSFEGRIGDFVDISFELKENNNIVDDITDVWVYYGNNIRQGAYDNVNKIIHVYVPNVATMTEMTIICKSQTHKPFTHTIDIRRLNQYDETGLNIEHQYIEGPLVDGAKNLLAYHTEWHTADVRNLIQKQGIYFRNVIKNIDEQSSTTIKIYNTKLKICYSQKQSNFTLNTYIQKKDVKAPYIGKYIYSIENVGEKPLKTYIDIITPPNIKMETNNVLVDLKVGQGMQGEINILPSYPIDDGFYDIITTCEDQIKKDRIEVISDGLIQTGVNVVPHHGKYSDVISLSAEVYAVDKSIINGGVNRVQFYINNFAVGDPVVVQNNKANATINITNKNFIGTGNLPLEARFLGTNKYASSRGKSTIFISKDDTRMTLYANSIAPYKGSFEVRAKVEYFNGEDYLPVDKGSVEFYIDDEILSSNVLLENGFFVATINKIENPPKEYTLWGKYSGTDEYSATETSQPLEIIGGDTKTTVFDVEAKPQDTIVLKAHVVDMNNKNIISGYIDFSIKDNENNDVTFNIPNFHQLITNVPVHNGLAISPEFIVNVALESDLNSKIYTINAKFHYTLTPLDNSEYQPSENTGYLSITKGKTLLEYQPMFYGTQYEPLGFYIKVKDAVTEQPITNGKIRIKLKKEDVTIEEDVDENGVACLLYKPLEYTAKQWQELEKTSFDVVSDFLHRYSSKDNPDLSLVDFEYHTDDGTLHFITTESVQLSDSTYIQYNANENKYYVADKTTNKILEEYENLLYITDGHLYARTTQDSLRQYILGLQNVEISYISGGQYENKINTIKNGLEIKKSDVDLDIHTYDLRYTDTDNIYCYVTQYSFQDGITDNLITDGKVEFIIDDKSFETIDVVNGKAVLDNKFLTNIPAGHHLIKVKYIEPQNSQQVNNISYSYNPPSYSYSILTLHKDRPQIGIRVTREIPNLYSDIFVDIYNPNPNISLSGLVDLYLDDELIGSQYLNGNEDRPGIVDETALTEGNISDHISTIKFGTIMPNDINIEGQHSLKAVYQGNEFFLSNDFIYELYAKPAPVEIDVKNDIYVARGEKCTIDIDVSCYDDIISEGQIILKHGNTERAIANVINNKATLSWIPNANDLDYTLSYRNATVYQDKDVSLTVHIIDPLSAISIPNEHQTNIEEALMCLQPNGTITLLEDINLTKSIEIDKNCTIIGENGTSIIKDVRDLVSDFDDIPITSLSMDDKYEIKDLSLQNLNTTDFRIQFNGTEKELTFKTQSGYIPIYLTDDGKFYSDIKLDLSRILSDVNLIVNEGVNVHLDNLTFRSNDSSSIADFAIYNKGTCEITHSIIQPTAKIFNTGTLTAHRNLIYGRVQGDEADLDNNWWGSNTAPYKVNNNIIIQVKSIDTPAVISEEVDIIGEMIGANGQHYDMPQVQFSFAANTGYFSIDAGMLTNNQIRTIYLDAEEEGEVRFTVDNETVSCPIYDYERKTEVIIEDIEEVLINYQIPITGKVQSCADTYYEFDDNNNVIKSTKTINEGYMTFFIDDQQVGYQKVQNGEAKVLIYFKENVYTLNEIYNLTIKYHSSENYFDSMATIPIKIISEEGICFVSPSGSDSGDGTYGNPLATITKALESSQKIYLLNGEYTEKYIAIKHNVTIKKYNGRVVFKNLEKTPESGNLFSIWGSNKIVNISGIDFIGNKYTNIFRNDNGSLSIQKCIFYNNDATLFAHTAEIPRFNISHSIIVDNTKISNKINTNDYTYCWFGTNFEDANPNNFNNYIIMTNKQSKDKIYMGTLAHVTAELQYYNDNGNIYKLDEKLPLRIAKFATDVGSAKPIKDYTYNNKSTSLINTLDKNNTEQIIITLTNNTFYEGHNINLVFDINDVFDNPAYKTDAQNRPLPTDKISMQIIGENINVDEKIQNNKGVAQYNIDSLSKGTYTVICSYDYNGRTYTLNTSFNVKAIDIIVSDVILDNNSHLYYTDIDAVIQDNFGNNINSELINIKIDDNTIKTIRVNNGVIHDKITYSLLSPGKHKLTIDNVGINTSYDTLQYNQYFMVKQQKTEIDFDYDTFETNVHNTLIVEINDEEGREVQTGTITAEIDNEEIAVVNVSNGIAILDNIIFTEKGQHSIALYYTDINGFYDDSVFVNSQIGAGIYHVIFSINETDIIKADIGKNLVLQSSVQDIGKQNVTGGYINIYIDDSLFAEEIRITDGQFNVNEKLPDGIASGMHRLTIEYTGNNKYLDTTLNTYLNIGQIKTSIGVEAISGASGQKTTVNYTIDSAYGNVNTGILTAYYNEQPIGTSIVTDSIVNQITVNVPLLPSGNDYEILLKYHDETNFEDSEKTVKLIIEKSYVKITPQKTWYYPQKDFNFVVDVRDAEDKIIDQGAIELYIDNVKEYDNVAVLNGQAIIPLIFNNARSYNLDIVYKEDEYYLQTHQVQVFNVTGIDIGEDNILFESPLKNLPNQLHSNKIIFNIPDYNIKDGMIDIEFDNNYVKTYHIAENNKYVDFDIGDEVKGTHSLTIKYYNSSLFNDITKTFDFTILSKTVEIRLNIDNKQSQDINAISNDEINIQTSFGNIVNNDWIYQQMTGIVKYYIQIPQYRVSDNNEDYVFDYEDRFIGLENFNDQHTLTHMYILTSDLLQYSNDNLETHYRIKAHFIGNDEYDECEEIINLNIHKQNTKIVLPNDMFFEYQSEVNINVQLLTTSNDNVIGKETVDMYINNDFIGSCDVMNGEGLFTYRLHNKYAIDTYTLRAVFNGSAINYPSEAQVSFTITPFKPTLKTNTIQVPIGGKLILDNVIYDKNGVAITSGQLIYRLNNQVIAEATPNVATLVNISPDYTTNQTLKAEYISADQTKYNNFNRDITLEMVKNDIKLSIDAPERVYRGEPFDVTVTAACDTTSIPINLTFNEGEMTNGILNTSITYPVSAEDNSVFQEYISTEGNQYFNANQILLSVHTQNKDTVTVKTSVAESASNAHTLAKAIDLVNDYGTIQVISSLSNQVVDELSKNVTIEGTAQLSKCIINNENKRLTIKGLTFKNGTETCIYNEGALEVDGCTFDTNSGSIIEGNGTILITNSDFTNNTNTCIKVGNKNYKTTISGCRFNNNNVSLSNGLIYSNKVNNMEILNNEFAHNNLNNTTGTCIYAYGNINISSNTFYNNKGKSDINLLTGTFGIENNLFDGNKISASTSKPSVYVQFTNNTTIDADLNYWGYNNIDSIKACNPNVPINNYLIAQCEFYDKADGHYVIGSINQYINRLETEVVTINTLDKVFPILINDSMHDSNDNMYVINTEIPISNEDMVKIGQDTFEAGD